jgi:hypothetical protein
MAVVVAYNREILIMNIPCDKCICLPACRARYLRYYITARSPLSNLRILSDMCEMLDDYFFKDIYKRADRIFATIDFLKGKTK